MAIELLVGAVVGTGALCLYSWRRLRNIHLYWDWRKRADAAELALREARDALLTMSYRPATADDSQLLGPIAGDQTALEACGFAALGDIVGQVGDQRRQVMRAFCDRSQTTCALATVSVNSPATSGLALHSYADDQMFVTHRSRGLACPPFLHHQMLAAALPHPQLVDRHRTFATATPLVSITTQAALLAVFARFHAKIARWRETQAPDELLDADLKSVLGDAYARSGKAWARRLRAGLPEATIRRG